ncbi:hypothetical protein [Anoxybacteroides rupiense]|uniref:Uncharacterized protein n=1 Tax=Anoxybacteroides rupiense TaxID=311460 RepID=A0ABD5IWR5_9BACL|nr:hypothetical protein [Anoxybacillus rupiensis]MBB3908844.1 hypothetical protein [Anoxybacillus rupiensis]MED5052788.1 hypothetical protein [Anoxybacillus rupiensis]
MLVSKLLNGAVKRFVLRPSNRRTAAAQDPAFIPVYRANGHTKHSGE